MSTLRWGLIGASDIASSRLIPAMRRLNQSPVSVLSASQARANAYAQANDLPSAGTDLDALLSRDDVDAVYISTTNELHAPQALAAAAAGKHVLCEKPIAMSLTDAREIVLACERAGVTLAANHHLPAAGTHRKIKELVCNGAIGKPLAVRIFHAVSLPERLRGWRLTDAGRGGGVIMDITCHDAAALAPILGVDALEVTAIACKQGDWEASVEDAVMTVMRFEGDVLVQTHDAFTIGYADTGMQVHGSEGSIIATGIMGQDPAGSIVVRDAGGEHVVEPADRRDLYDVTLEAFSSAVAGYGSPIVDGIAGLKAVAIALATKHAAETGETVAVASEASSNPGSERSHLCG